MTWKLVTMAEITADPDAGDRITVERNPGKGRGSRRSWLITVTRPGLHPGKIETSKLAVTWDELTALGEKIQELR